MIWLYITGALIHLAVLLKFYWKGLKETARWNSTHFECTLYESFKIKTFVEPFEIPLFLFASALWPVTLVCVYLNERGAKG